MAGTIPTCVGLLPATTFIIFVMVSLVTPPLLAEGAALPIPTAHLQSKGKMTICALLWGSLNDGGFTEAHKDGLVAAVKQYNTLYQSHDNNFSFHHEWIANARLPEGTDADSMAVKETRLAKMFDDHDCDILVATFTDTFGSWESLMRHVHRRPQTLFVIEDPHYHTKHDFNAYRNLILVGSNCDKSWFLAGYSAASEVAYGGCVGLATAFHGQMTDAQYAFQRGVQQAASELGDPTKSAVIVPVGSWIDEEKETAVIKALLNVAKCDIIGHMTDEPLASSIMASQSQTPDRRWSIGWTFDRRPDYGDTVLLSVLREYTEMFSALIHQWIDDNVREEFQVFECPITPLSNKVLSTTQQRFDAMSATLNISRDLWTRPVWRDREGNVQGHGTLNDTQILSMTWFPEDLVQSELFQDASTCIDGYSAEYVFDRSTGIDSTATLELKCAPCPINTYRPLQAAAGDPNPTACKPCPDGEVSDAGSTTCAPPSSSNEDTSSSSTISAAVVGIIVACICVAVLLIVVIVLMVRRRNASTADEDRHSNAPMGTDTTDRSTWDTMGSSQMRASGYARNSTMASSSIFAHSGRALTESDSQARSQLAPISDVGVVDVEVEKQRRVQMIENNFFYVGQIIGKGATGVVYRVVLQDGSTMAMKEIMGTAEGESRELEIAANLPPHPNILKHYVVRYNKQKCSTMIFMELMTGGSLRSVVKEVHRSLADVTARAFTTQIISALAFLHRSNVVHRDLKCDNILVDSDGRCKLADFGTAKQVSDSITSLTFVGTPLWMAPEILLGSQQADNVDSCKKADVWAVGILVAEMLGRGKPPWPTFDSAIEAIKYIEDGGALIMPQGISPMATKFIEACTAKDPKDRPHCEDLLSHEWLSFDPTSSMSEAGSEESSTASSHLSKPNSYSVGPVIGVGAFGTVHKAKLEDGSIVAVKTMTFNSKENALSKRLRRLSREISTMKALDHPNIVRYLFTDKQSLVSHDSDSMDHMMLIFMEYVGGGTLKSKVDRKAGMKDDMAKQYIRALFSGLAYLHSKNIAHRDVKPSNCLLCPPPHYVKVGDFGTAACLGSNVTVSLTMQGTLLYMAPEIIQERTPSTAADIWSAGVTAMELLSGESPWSNVAKGNSLSVASYVASDQPIVLPESLSAEAKEFLGRCLDRDPVKRADAATLLNDPWLQDEHLSYPSTSVHIRPNKE